MAWYEVTCPVCGRLAAEEIMVETDDCLVALYCLRCGEGLEVRIPKDEEEEKLASI